MIYSTLMQKGIKLFLLYGNCLLRFPHSQCTKHYSQNGVNRKAENDLDIFISLLKAFALGGAICLIGQILIDMTKLTPGRILVMFVVAGVVLTAIGLYEPLEKWAEAGATVPLTGFGYAMAKGIEKAIEEQGAMGILTGALTASSGGVTAAVLCGLIASFVTKPKEKE